MARTLENLRDLQTEFMVLDLDNSKGESPTTGNQNEQINWSYRAICRQVGLFDPAIVLTAVAGQALYNTRDITTPAVSKKVVEVKGVYINNNPLAKADGMTRGLWTLQELERIHPGWRSAANGTPYVALQQNYNVLRLFPAPTAAIVSSGNNFIAGTYLPPDMSNNSDVPDLPEELHEIIAYGAAVKAALPVVTEQEMWNRIKAYSAESIDAIRDLAAMQKRLLSDWGTIGGYPTTDYILT